MDHYSNTPAEGPQTVGPSVPKALKLAIPEKVAWRSRNPGIEAVVRLIQVKNAMSDGIVNFESIRVW